MEQKTPTHRLGAIFICAFFIFSSVYTSAQTVNTAFPTTDGLVTSTSVMNGAVFFGGTFNNYGDRIGHGVNITSAGVTETNWPIIDGDVFAVISDGVQGRFVAGNFTTVDGQQQLRLVKINSAGQLVAAFNPNIISGTVRTLTLSGNSLYIGGDMSVQLGGTTISHIARLDATTGVLQTNFNFTIGGTGAVVNALEVDQPNNALYAGGNFATVNGFTRTNLAKFDNVLTGTPALNTSFIKSTNDEVLALTLSINKNNVFIGGRFTTVGSQTRRRLAKIKASNASVVTAFSANANDVVHALHIKNDRLWVGGAFTTIKGSNRSLLAKVATGNGSVKSLKISGTTNGAIFALSLDAGNNDVYVGGSFTIIDGAFRDQLAKIDKNGNVQTWTGPNFDADVRAVRLFNDGDVYVGGEFEYDGTNFATPNLGGHNPTTGTTFSGYPNVSSDTRAVIAYVANGFNLVHAGGTGNFGNSVPPRQNVAQYFDTGALSGLDFGINGAVEAFAHSGTTWLIGGAFTAVYGVTTRNRILAINTDIWTLNAFNPNANNTVTAIAINGNDVYFGGTFTSVGGTARTRLAKYNIATNTLDATWAPAFTGTSIDAIEVSANGQDIYVAGLFTAIGGQTRSNIARLNNTNGNADAAWNPGANGRVRAIALNGTGSLYIGGDFTSAGSPATGRNRAAELNTANSAVTGWDPDCDGVVNAISVLGTNVILGGGFIKVGGVHARSLASVTQAFPKQSVTPERLNEIVTSEGAPALYSYPNPAASASTVSFSVPTDAYVTVSVFTATGERVATLFNGPAQAGELHQATFNAAEAAPGVYFVRLQYGDLQTVHQIRIVR